MTKRHPPPMGEIEIEGTETLALIDTGATMNMDLVMLDKLKTRPIVRHTKMKRYPYGSTMPLTLRGVIDATVKSGTEKVKTTFYITEEQYSTLLGCNTSEALQLVSFAKHRRRDRMIALTRSREWLRGTSMDHGQSMDETRTMPRQGDALH